MSEDGATGYNYEDKVKKLKENILDKLNDFDWLERMRLRIRTFIENNGVKIISAEEVEDFIIEEALRTFPANLKEQIMTEINQILGDWVLLGDGQ